MLAPESPKAARRLREEAAGWALKRAEGALAAREAARFESWLAASPEHARAFARAERALKDSRALLLGDPDFARKAGRRARSRAPLVVLALAAATGLFLAFDGPMRLSADVIAGTGEMPVVELADGSRVQLNARAAIAVDITAGHREVRLLRGEAFFEVKADAGRPFAVIAGGGRVSVLGTAFDVRLTEHGGEVAVLEHRVAVSGAAPGAAVAIGEGERLAFGAEGAIGAPSAIDRADIGAWRQNRLVVVDEPLGSVIGRIDDRLAGRVLVLSPALAARRISGSFDIRDPDAALAILQATFGFTMHRVGPLLTVLYG